MLSYQLSTDDLWPIDEFHEEEIEIQPGHSDTVLIAERELNNDDYSSLRTVRCIFRSASQIAVLSSCRDQNLHKIAALLAYEFTASRFSDRLQKNWNLLRLFKA